jgi:hypothetical protein
MKSYSFILLFIFNCFTIVAQEIKPPRPQYLFLGFNIPLVKVRDLAHSPLLYKGFTPALRLGFERLNEKYVSRISVSASFGQARPKMQQKKERHLSVVEVSNVQLNFAHYAILDKYDTEGWNRYVGGALTFTFDTRNYNLPSNNLFGYQANVSLNGGGFVRKKISNTWQFNYEAFTPVLSYALRPNYLGMLPLKGGDFSPKNVFTNGKIVTFNKLFRFYNRFAFDNQFKDYRARRMAYYWDFHANYVAPKPLHSVESGFGFEALYKN